MSEDRAAAAGSARFRFAAQEWAEIAGYLRLGNPDVPQRLRAFLELRIDFALRVIRAAQKNGGATLRRELEKLEEAQKVLKDFVHCLYGHGTTVDKAADFVPMLSRALFGLELDSDFEYDEPNHRWRSVPRPQPVPFRSDFPDRSLARELQGLSRLINGARDDLETASKYDVKRGTPVCLAALDRVIEVGVKLWGAHHELIPLPQKKKNGDKGPAGPFDRYMAILIEPVAAELRVLTGANYPWRTLVNHVEQVRARILASTPIG